MFYVPNFVRRRRQVNAPLIIVHGHASTHGGVGQPVAGTGWNNVHDQVRVLASIGNGSVARNESDLSECQVFRLVDKLSLVRAAHVQGNGNIDHAQISRFQLELIQRTASKLSLQGHII
jgi:hypothetical protein